MAVAKWMLLIALINTLATHPPRFAVQEAESVLQVLVSVHLRLLAFQDMSYVKMELALHLWRHVLRPFFVL